MIYYKQCIVSDEYLVFNPCTSPNSSAVGCTNSLTVKTCQKLNFEIENWLYFQDSKRKIEQPLKKEKKNNRNTDNNLEPKSTLLKLNTKYTQVPWNSDQHQFSFNYCVTDHLRVINL